MLKILVLWSHSSGYLHGCLQNLAQHANLTVVAFFPSNDAPYSPQIFADAKYNLLYLNPDDKYSSKKVVSLALDTNPDLCLVSGWHHSFYMKALDKLKSSDSISVLCFDWQWKPSLRNYIKSLYGKLYRSHYFHACFVSGERQAQFALRVGFKHETIFQGLYASSIRRKDLGWEDRLNQIIFIGRLVDSKGCKFLASAWQHLQDQSLLPLSWTLEVYGVGPLEGLFRVLPQCNVHGFVQPSEITDRLHAAKILCAPSIYEPWGLQIHEAACAGLALIATHACGASVHLVRSGYNGEVVKTSDHYAIASAIRRLIALDSDCDSYLKEYAHRSQMLSKQFTPDTWSATVLRIYEDISTIQIRS